MNEHADSNNHHTVTPFGQPGGHVLKHDLDRSGHFAQRWFESQHAFRRVLEAFAEPGQPRSLDIPAVATGLGVAAVAGAALLSLLDSSARLWVSSMLSPDIARMLRFHTGVQVANCVGDADHVLLSGPNELLAIDTFMAGTPLDPHASALVIVPVAELSGGSPRSLSGPGLRTEALFAPLGVSDLVWEELARSHARFPVGIDVLFVCDFQVVGLPRSTRIALVNERHNDSEHNDSKHNESQHDSGQHESRNF